MDGNIIPSTHFNVSLARVYLKFIDNVFLVSKEYLSFTKCLFNPKLSS